MAHKPTILLVTPPPLNEVHLEDEDLKKGYQALSRHQKVTAQYAQAVREVAEEHQDKNVVLVDLWTALTQKAATLTPTYSEQDGLIGSKETGDSQGLRILLRDGLHLSSEGYKVFSNEVLQHIGPDWASEPFDQPSWVFPHWSNAPRVY